MMYPTDIHVFCDVHECDILWLIRHSYFVKNRTLNNTHRSQGTTPNGIFISLSIKKQYIFILIHGFVRIATEKKTTVVLTSSTVLEAST